MYCTRRKRGPGGRPFLSLQASSHARQPMHSTLLWLNPNCMSGTTGVYTSRLWRRIAALSAALSCRSAMVSVPPSVIAPENVTACSCYLVPPWSMRQVGLLQVDQKGIECEGARRTRRVQGQKVGIAGPVHSALIAIHPCAFVEHDDSRHTAFRDVSRRHTGSAVIPDVNIVARLDPQPFRIRGVDRHLLLVGFVENISILPVGVWNGMPCSILSWKATRGRGSLNLYMPNFLNSSHVIVTFWCCITRPSHHSRR